jgi:hypothetical protein
MLGRLCVLLRLQRSLTEYWEKHTCRHLPTRIELKFLQDREKRNATELRTTLHMKS